MSSKTRFLAVPAMAIALIAMASSSLMAQCNSCASSGGQFGFPSQGCSSCGGGGGGIGGAFGGGIGQAYRNMQQGMDTYKADWARNRARNSAWPMPFSCWDREHYHAIFNQQYATGNQIAHTLLAEHFDPETNELNRSGELRVSWIMTHSPRDSKQIYVFEDTQGPVVDQRIASVRNLTNRFYSHLSLIHI